MEDDVAEAAEGAEGAGAGADGAEVAEKPRFRVVEEMIVEYKTQKMATLQARLNRLPPGADARAVYFTRSRDGPLPAASERIDDDMSEYVEYGVVTVDSLKTLEVVVQVRWCADRCGGAVCSCPCGCRLSRVVTCVS